MDKLAVALMFMVLAAVLFVGPVYLIWNYALVPATKWANPVGFGEAFGIACLIAMMRGSSGERGSKSKDKEKEGAVMANP